jgi:hypothetical protein
MKVLSIVALFLIAAASSLAQAQPPACQSVAPSNGLLWPPNGKFENITISGLSAGQSVVMTAVKQDEDPGAGPQRGSGRGRPSFVPKFIKKLFKRNNKSNNTTDSEEGFGPTGAADAVIEGGVAMIRHERLGGGDGRVYHIYFNATNSTTNEVLCTGEVTVCVPKSKGNGGSGGGNGNGKDKGNDKNKGESNSTDTSMSCVHSSLNGGMLYDSLAGTKRMLRA